MRRNQAPTLTLRPILGTATTAMATGEATEATTDPTATMATTERGLLMKPTLPQPLDPTLTPLLILGTATTAMVTDPTAMATMATDTMATMERGLLMKAPLSSLAPTLMLRLTPGTDTTATRLGQMDKLIMAIDPTAMPTGDKKWTSRTTSDLFLPTHL